MGGKGKGDGKGKGKGGRPDPRQMATAFLREYDKDGDKALNLEELTAALEGMMQRMQRRQQFGKGKGGFEGKGKGKGGFGGKGKGKGDE